LKAILRSAVIAAGLATSVMVGMTGATADPGAGVFTGSANINCFGCGTSNGKAHLDVTGTVSGGVDATFTVNEPAATCPVQGSATGSTTGAVTVNFVWTRLGATAVITTTGQINGAGVAAFVVVGLPCGGPVTATVAGALAGV
jgi:hypothetical protein